MSTSKHCPRTWTRFCSCQCEHLVDPLWAVAVWKTPYFLLWQGTWGSPTEAQGLPFTQVRLLEGKFSFCIENKNGTGFFLGDIPKQYCDQALWLDSTDGGTSNPPWMLQMSSRLIIMTKCLPSHWAVFLVCRPHKWDLEQLSCFPGWSARCPRLQKGQPEFWNDPGR